ncbi:hypothetical protein BGZ99_001830 [Dissophora globulifera]|uniref:Uncharacterized protein n=1 Tax=Dissophora globulifera TaxID=979702 RepID=A0A9P6QYZ3_9FUNG|nr:hypothetical protein BGZ99_001830 [Dissophora globulifera]
MSTQKNQSERLLQPVNNNVEVPLPLFSKGRKNIMGLFHRNRPAQEALMLFNTYLKIASSTEDRKQALDYCKAAKKELERIKISKSLTYLDQIIAAYRERGDILKKLGFGGEAKISYDMADNM